MLTMPEEFSAGIDKCCDPEGRFHYQRWATDGMPQLSPLWLLKYLPNMPASHVAIFNDLRGPNNSITLARGGFESGRGRGLSHYHARPCRGDGRRGNRHARASDEDHSRHSESKSWQRMALSQPRPADHLTFIAWGWCWARGQPR